MSKKYIYMFLFFIIFIFSTYIFSFKYLKIEQVKNVYNSNDLKCKYSILNIKEKGKNYEILAYYPVTENVNLNNDILYKVNLYIDKFKNELIGNSNNLKIQFNYYEKDIYTSFVFNVLVDSDTAHKSEYIFSSNFNNKEKKVMNIDDILINNNNSLKNISELIYKNLKENENIKKYINEKTLKEYFDLNKEKYECFYFSKDGVVFYFNMDEILPKSVGIIYTLISYDYIK